MDNLNKTSSRRDWLGVFASILCAIHCAAMPFIISYLPALGLTFLANELFHKVMVFVCFSIAIYAFIPGLLRHRKWAPVTFGTVGLMFITVAAFAVEDDCCTPLGEGGVVLDCCATDCDADNTDDSAFLADTTTDNETTSIQDFLSQFALWITPLGGAFLVLGHLLNKRFGHACHCCSSETED